MTQRERFALWAVAKATLSSFVLPATLNHYAILHPR